MENLEDIIEKEYKQRFKDFEESPPDFLWEQIQNRIQPERKPKMIVWWQMGIAASVVIGLSCAIYFLNLTETKVSETLKTPSQNSDNQQIKDNFIAIENPKKATKISNTQKMVDPSADTLNLKNYPEKPILKNNMVNYQISQSTIQVPNIENETINTDLENKTSINQIAIEEKQKTEIESEIIVKNDAPKDKINQNQKITENNNEKLTIINPETDLVSESVNYQLSKIDFEEITQIDPLKLQAIPVVTANKIPKITDFEPNTEPQSKRVLAFIPPTEIFINVSPMLNYYVISPNKSDNYLVKNISGSSQRLGIAAQIGFIYPLGQKFDLRNSISYFSGKSNLSYELQGNSQKIVEVIDDRSINFLNQELITKESKIFRFIEYQTDLMYKIKQLQAFSLGLRAGFQPNNFKNPAINARIGYRISKPISNQMAFWIEPTFSVSLTKQKSLENFFVYRNAGFGINIGASLLK